MRYIFQFFIFLNLFFVANSFSQANNGYEIKITVNGLNSTPCYLAYYYADGRYIADSSLLDVNGKCIFKGDRKLEPGIYLVLFPEKNDYFDIVVNEQNFAIEVNYPNFIDSMKVVGSKENLLFNQYHKDVNKIQERIFEIRNRKELPPEIIRSQVAQEQRAIRKIKIDFVKENKNTFIAKVINMMLDVEVPGSLNGNNHEIDTVFYKNYIKEHYFDNIDFSDNRLIRTPLLHNRIKYYLDKITDKNTNANIDASMFIIEKSKSDSIMFQYVIKSLLNKFGSSNHRWQHEVFVELFERYYLTGQAYWADSSEINRIKESVLKISPTLIGETAPDIFLSDTSGNIVPLHSVKSKYTIIYFYDPDCESCNAVTPEVMKVYKNLKDSLNIDLKVYMANVSGNTELWKKYINENNYDCIHVIDADFKSDFREKYSLMTTPAIFLLGENKVVLGKKIEPKEVERIITNR